MQETVSDEARGDQWGVRSIDIGTKLLYCGLFIEYADDVNFFSFNSCAK